MPDGTGPAEHKKHLVDYPPKEAFFVHLTTGLNGNLPWDERGAYKVRTEVFRKFDQLMP
jgi:hypothetical protein